MHTMDINTFIEQNGSDLTTQERQEIIYYVDNAINNLAASEKKMPVSGNILGRFGSTNSNDVDLFFLLKEEKSQKFTNLIQSYLQQSIDSMVGSGDIARTLDIQFITTYRGQVNWSSRGGNIAEINNAIYHTYHNHILNFDVGENQYRDCPVTSEAIMDVGIKALTSVRALLSIISRTSHGSTVKRLLLSNSLSQRIDALKEIHEDSGIFSSVEESLGKNLSDEALLKDVTFSFIQLDAMLNDKPVPFTKNAVFNTEHTELLPFMFEMANFGNVYAPQLVKLDEFIIKTLDTLKERIMVDGEGVVRIQDDRHSYSIRKEIVVNE